MAIIEVSNVKKSFGKLEVLNDVSFTVEKGDVVAIIGPSGSGKSTLLRGLINLESFDGGSVRVDGDFLVKDGAYPQHNKLRDITMRMGMVFQGFNLFPHYNVLQNLIVPYMTVKGAGKAEAEKRAAELLEKVGLADRTEAMPSHLSGGQKQRVAIARALMLNPEIMLFDEPTSALDPQLTGEVLNVMKQLAGEKMTMIVVTHELGFAKEAATKVLFMKNGVIAEEGVPGEMFANPQNPETAKFIGLAQNK